MSNSEHPQPDKEHPSSPAPAPAKKKRKARSTTRGTKIKGAKAGRPGTFKWKLRAYAGRDQSGKPIYRYAPEQFIGTSAEADVALAAHVATTIPAAVAIASGQVSPTMTLDEFWDVYSTLKLPKLSPTTRGGYRSKYSCYVQPVLGRTQLRSITALTLEALYADLKRQGFEPWTLRHVHKLISGMLTCAARWGGGPTLHAAKLCEAPPQPTSTRPRAPKPADVKALIHDPDESPLLTLFERLEAIMAGRRGEVTGLRWNDVDLDNEWVECVNVAREFDTIDRLARLAAGHSARDARMEIAPISKREEHNSVDIGSRTAELLRIERQRQQAEAGEITRVAGVTCTIEDDDFIFRTDLTSPLPDTPSSWSARFRKHKAKVGVTMRMHDLRHFVGTEVSDAKGIHVAQEVLGHSRVTTTEVYARKRASRTAKILTDVLDETA